MIIGDAVFGLIKGLIAPISTVVGNWQKRKSVKLESDVKIAEARTTSIINRLTTKQEGDISWENLSIDKSGWKDEFFTVVLSVPAILCFIPGCVAYVREGFIALNSMPGWYQWAFSIAVGSAFGYKRIADFMSLKKGN